MILPIMALSLASCCENTKDWPRIALCVETNEILSYSVHCIIRQTDNSEYINDSKTTTKRESIEKNIRGLQSFPYKKETSKYDKEKQWDAFLEATLVAEYRQYIVKFYEYGVGNCLVCFEKDEWHFLPGNFTGLYRDFVE